jgi:four helix bundle protein
MNIALKEAKEAEYWIDLVKNTKKYEGDWKSLLDDCIEIIKILHSIVKTTRNTLNAK